MESVVHNEIQCVFAGLETGSDGKSREMVITGRRRDGIAGVYTVEEDAHSGIIGAPQPRQVDGVSALRQSERSLICVIATLGGLWGIGGTGVRTSRCRWSEAFVSGRPNPPRIQCVLHPIMKTN